MKWNVRLRQETNKSSAAKKLLVSILSCDVKSEKRSQTNSIYDLLIIKCNLHIFLIMSYVNFGSREKCVLFFKVLFDQAMKMKFGFRSKYLQSLQQIHGDDVLNSSVSRCIIFIQPVELSSMLKCITAVHGITP